MVLFISLLLNFFYYQNNQEIRTELEIKANEINEIVAEHNSLAMDRNDLQLQIVELEAEKELLIKNSKREISELEDQIVKLEDLSNCENGGDEALINLLLYENKKLYDLIDNDRILMDDSYRLKSYMDLRYIRKGNEIGDFIINEYSTDNEKFFRKFAINFTGTIVIEGSFINISNADYNGIVFQVDEHYGNILPYVIELQNIKFLHINNYEDCLSEADIALLLSNSVERIEKNIKISNLLISGQLGSDIFYSCNIIEAN